MSRPAGASRGRDAAFTLVELLVVIGIMAVLIAILVPTISSVRRSAERNAVRQELQAIGMALDAYRADFNDYPRPPDGQRKYRVLAWALIGPYDATIGSGPVDPLQSAGTMTDGADGPGFRTVTGGKVWGPYLAPEKFPVSSSDFPDPQKWDLMDRYGRPIEYYPRWRKPTPGASLFSGIYDYQQQWQSDPKQTPAKNYPAAQYLRKALGDDDLNDTIDAKEALKETPPFILISRGASTVFPDDNTIKTNFDKCDVLTNLQH